MSDSTAAAKITPANFEPVEELDAVAHLPLPLLTRSLICICLARPRLHLEIDAGPMEDPNDTDTEAERLLREGITLREAAVLIPIVDRSHGLSVVLTRRADHLPSHAGQIGFPGGTIKSTDPDMAATALRETHEEIGVAPEYVDIAGELTPHVTGTGFRIHPLVGFLRDGFPIVADENEVAEVFEVPLTFLLDPANRQRLSASWKGRKRRFYAMTYEGRFIWGATAAILVELSRRVVEA